MELWFDMQSMPGLSVVQQGVDLRLGGISQGCRKGKIIDQYYILSQQAIFGG